MNSHDNAYQSITAAYDVASRNRDREVDFLGAYIYRPLSFGLTVPFMRGGWSADQVTWLRIFVVAVAFGLLAFGQHWSTTVGAMLCLVNVFLDHVDGNLARLQGPSDFGGFLDEIADILVKIFTPVAIAVGLFIRPDRFLGTFDIEDWMILVVGVVTGLVSATRAFLKAEFADRKAKACARRDPMPPDNDQASVLSTATLSVPYVYRTGVSLMLLLLPLFAVVDLLSIYLCLIFLSRTLVFPLELVSLVREAGKEFVDG